jgi:hypothetical protein
MRVVVILFAVVVLAQSQQPPPTPLKGGNKQQGQTTDKNKKPATNNQPAPSIPTTDQTEPQHPSSGIGDKPDNKNKAPSFDNGIRLTDEIVAGATVAIALLALIQIGVYCKQANLMRHGLQVSTTQARIANKSAIAAKQSAETARASLEVSQRAYLKIGVPKPDGFTLAIPVINYGHVPCMRLSGRLIYSKVGLGANWNSDSEGIPTEIYSAEAIRPGEALTFFVTLPNSSPEENLAFDSGGWARSVAGRFEYDTGFSSTDVLMIGLSSVKLDTWTTSGQGISVDFNSPQPPNEHGHS